MTGGSGFVGRAVVRHLVARGDDVTVAVRDRRRLMDVADLDGATIVENDLVDVRRVADDLRDVESVIHAAGSYRVGIARSERGAMWDANIGTTTRVLDAAEQAGVKRILYVSTVGVFGNTHGGVVDEGYRRDLREGFLSWYDETKYGAHEVAQQRAAAGAPVVTVMPSQVYGPGDHSAIGDQIRRAHAGRLRALALDDVGLGFVDVDDLAAGIIAALDRGAVGQAYVLSGPRARLREVLATAARLGGRSLPALRVPAALVRALVPLGGAIGRPGLAEIVASGAGVTYWATSA
ncbi:MAG TPA: NAD-dependent epimerase/dehydratase family protein, partial [Candidatus Acidoferrales bacterium]|nr:NAD-dependent epimerase/dehydratase family protein [Candidatus Acidoferrales bacterium]